MPKTNLDLRRELESKDLSVYWVGPNLDASIKTIAERIEISKEEALRSSITLFDFITRHVVEGWKCSLSKDGEPNKEIPFIKPNS